MCCKLCTAVNERCLKGVSVMCSFFLFSPSGKMRAFLTVDMLLVFRYGRSHGDGGSNIKGSAERTEWRGDAAGDGQVPFCVFG